MDGPHPDRGRLGAAISDEIAALLRDALGRGPKRARAYVQEDVVFCVIQETMTTFEETLRQEHRDDTVKYLREVLHDVIGQTAAARVEQLTGRRVVATLADHDHESDIGVLALVFEPVAATAG